MAIKVLKQGTPPEEKVYQATCQRCGSELEFQQKDGRYVSDQRDGDAIVVKCPVCNSEVWVKW